MPEQQLTVEDLGRAAKAKYAGAYDDLDDAELGRLVQKKYPGAYDDYAPIARPTAPVAAAPAQVVQPYAAQPPAGQLMHPQQVDAMTAQNAQAMAPAFAQAQEEPSILDNLRSVLTGNVNVGDTAIGRAMGIGQEKIQGRQTPTMDLPLVKFEGALPPQNQQDPNWLKAGLGAATGAAKLASGMTTPENIAIMAATSGLGAVGVMGRALLPRLVSAGFSLEMIKGLYDQAPAVRDAIKSGDYGKAAEALTMAAGTAALAALGVRHAVKGGGPAAPKPEEGTATITGKELYRPPAEPTQSPAQQPAQQPAAKPVGPQLSDQDLQRLLKIETNPAKRGILAAMARARGVPVPEVPHGPRVPVGKLAEGLTRTEQTLEYGKLFDEAEARTKKLAAKKARTAPVIPETGDADQRRKAAQDDIARKLTGKGYDEIDDDGRDAVDALVKEGYTGAQREAPSAKPTPAERAKAIKELRTGGMTYKAAVAQVDTPKAKVEPAKTPAPEVAGMQHLATGKTEAVQQPAPAAAPTQGVAAEPQSAPEAKVETLEYRGTGPAKRDYITVHVRHGEDGWSASGEGELGGHFGGYLGSSGYDKFHQTRQAAIDAFVKSATRPQSTLTAQLGSGYEQFAPRQKKMVDWVHSLASKPDAPAEPPPAGEPQSAPEAKAEGRITSSWVDVSRPLLDRLEQHIAAHPEAVTRPFGYRRAVMAPDGTGIGLGEYGREPGAKYHSPVENSDAPEKMTERHLEITAWLKNESHSEGGSTMSQAKVAATIKKILAAEPPKETPPPPAAPPPPNEFAAKRAEAMKKKYQEKNAARLEAKQQAFREANEAARARNEASSAPPKLAIVKPPSPAQPVAAKSVWENAAAPDWWRKAFGTETITEPWETVRDAYLARRPEQAMMDYAYDWANDKAEAGRDRRAAQPVAAKVEANDEPPTLQRGKELTRTLAGVKPEDLTEEEAKAWLDKYYAQSEAIYGLAGDKKTDPPAEKAALDAAKALERAVAPIKTKHDALRTARKAAIKAARDRETAEVDDAAAFRRATTIRPKNPTPGDIDRRRNDPAPLGYKVASYKNGNRLLIATGRPGIVQTFDTREWKWNDEYTGPVAKARERFVSYSDGSPLPQSELDQETAYIHGAWADARRAGKTEVEAAAEPPAPKPAAPDLGKHGITPQERENREEFHRQQEAEEEEAEKPAAPKAKAPKAVPPGTPSAEMFDELSAELAAIEKDSLYTKDTPGGSSLRDRAIDLRDTIEFHRPAAVARAQKAIDAEKGKRKRTIEESDGRQQPTADSGGAGEGRSLHEPAAPSPRPTPQAEARRGEATEVIVPDEKRSIPAHYEVRELDEIHPSHNGVTFSANPQYELENERDYSKPENQQRVIKQSSEDLFEPRYHITDNADMGNGPPLVTERGSAIGGNSRTMQLQRVYGRDGGKAAAYRAFLEKKASQFGIDPQVVRGMRQPVLVRVATPEGLEALPGGVKWAVRKTNVTGTAALSSSERAAADAGQMSPEMTTHIAGAIEAAGPDATLNDALTGTSGTRIVNSLIADGFFSEQERPSLMDGQTGVLTQSAKDRISKALLGKFFRNSDQIARTSASIKNKLERAAAPLAKVAGDPEWDITPDVREAIDLIEYASGHGIKNLGDALNQTSMFGDTPTSPEGVVRLAELLRDGKPNDVVNAFRKYVNSKEPTMFGESTPEEAFDDAFGAEKPAKRSSEHGGATLNQMTLGLASFVEQDVAPTLRKAAAGVRDTAEDIVRLLAPAVLSKPARQGSLVLREKTADLARKTDQAAAALEDAKRHFEKQDPEDNFEFMDRVERGQPQETPELDDIARVLRQMLNDRRRDVQALGTGKLQKFYANYFPHIWEKPERAKTVIAAFFGKRPLEGTKSFLKQRKYPTIADGRAAELVPLTDNPVDLVLLKVREMDKYVLAHETLNEWKKTRLARFIDAREGNVPPGWEKIDDPIGTVYGQSVQQISEYPNEGIYRGLEAVADALGLKHTRGFKNLRGAIGRAHISGGLVETAHGSREGTFAHEIGHQIDWLAGSGRKFVLDYPDAQTVQRLKAAYKTLKDENAPPADRTAARKELKLLRAAIADRREFAKQLRDLADLRDGPKEYVRKREEKMAQLAQMWVEGREVFQRTAPKVFEKWKEFLNENPKLHALRDIEAGATATALSQPYDVGGLVIKGHYWAPEGAARILNNYLSRGLGQYASYRAVMGVNNVLNQFQLGLSAFHLGFVTADTTVSKAALGYQALLRGKPIQAAKFFAQTPTAAFTTFLEGNRMLKEWYKPGSQGDLAGRMIDAAVKGGMRARMDTIYQTNARENMMKAFRDGNVWGVALRTPLAGVEYMANLIMNEVVPRMKMGAFADLARFQMDNMPAGATTEDIHRVLAQAADSIDNRLGEMVYDNLFWNKTAKDLAMISVRSVGWNLGTLREIGGGLTDIVAQPANKLRGKPVNLNRLSYLLGLGTVSAVTNAIYQYLHTGKGPEELKDYFFPKNGEKDENGRAQRISTPTYIKDVYHYGTHPLKTLEGKVAPIWSLAAEMIHNRDFYGTEIVNADDPLVQELAQIAKHLASAAIPIGVRNFQRETKLDASPLTRAEQFVGISPAPTDLDASGAERLAREYAAARVPDEPRTTASAARREVRQTLARSLAQGKPIPQNVRDALAAGQLTRRDVQEARRESRETSLVRSFTRLPIREALKVYSAATAQEKAELRGPLVKKARAAKETLAGAERAAMMDAVRGALGSR